MKEMHPAARTHLRETLAHLRGEKSFFRGACPRKKRFELFSRCDGKIRGESPSELPPPGGKRT